VYIEAMTMEISAKGAKKLASATEAPRDCDDKPLFPSKRRYGTRKTAVLSMSGLRCGCELWRGSNRA
jgi:hypothetical protein